MVECLISDPENWIQFPVGTKVISIFSTATWKKKHSPILTSLILSFAMAVRASPTFANCWWWFLGFLITRIRFPCSASMSAHRRIPLSKSSSKLLTSIPINLSCSFTQFLKVFSWMATHLSTPEVAAWPFRDLAITCDSMLFYIYPNRIKIILCFLIMFSVNSLNLGAQIKEIRYTQLPANLRINKY